MKLKRLILILAMLPLFCNLQAQRVTDKIDRGLVAGPSRTSGNFVSWRLFGEE